MRRGTGHLELLLCLAACACSSSERDQNPDARTHDPAEGADAAEHVSEADADDELGPGDPARDGGTNVDASAMAHTAADTADADEPADAAGDPDATQVQDASVEQDASSELDASTAQAGDSAEASVAPPDADAGHDSAACLTDCSTPEPFVPVRLSASDRSSCSVVSTSGFEVEFVDWGPCGVRSDAAITPGSGVFYFEGQRLTPRYHGGGLGVASAAATLTESAGASAQSLGVLATGALQNAGGSCSGSSALDPSLPELGFVVDYRASSPVIHVLQANPSGGALVAASCSMALSSPVYVFYSGDRAKVGPELRINTGADTTNFPFHFSPEQVRAALSAGGQSGAASVLVPGFGKTHAAAVDTAPVLEVSPDLSVPFGQAVTLVASASDAEDGPLDAAIEWLDIASPHHAPVRGLGPQLSFVPSSIGRHPVRVSVRDAAGVSTSRNILVDVTGSLPQAAPVQLARDALTGPGITISPDGLSVSFNGSGKDGIRANQGIYGRFWYFEVHRNSPIRNMGMGLVTADGALNPYEPARVPWSCSLNVLRGFWINLIDAGDWARSDLDTDYGFAVDYRGEHPVVHILIHGALQTTLRLTDVWLPLYPMLYGNPPDAPQSGWDMTLNFGTRPFAFDAAAVLGAAGVDATGLEPGWGL
jgi:hypothetical protein